MKTFACAVLLIFAGCMDDYSPDSARQRRNSDSSGICPEDDCFGLHQYEPPSKCRQCGAEELPTVHHFCKGCASRLQRCAHCGRKSPVKSAERKETPPPPAPAPPSPPVEKKAPPPPEPKARKPKPDERLAVEPVDLSDSARKSHSVVVFASEREKAKGFLDTHRTHKEADIAMLPVPRVGHDPGLFLVWGHYPEPTITELHLKAAFDEKSGTIRVTLPPLAGSRRDGGIGMDWGVDKDKSWSFVGFRVKLNTLPAGTYSFEVVEVEPQGKNPRVLSSGKFDLK